MSELIGKRIVGSEMSSPLEDLFAYQLDACGLFERQVDDAPNDEVTF